MSNNLDFQQVVWTKFNLVLEQWVCRRQIDQIEQLKKRTELLFLFPYSKYTYMMFWDRNNNGIDVYLYYIVLYYTVLYAHIIYTYSLKRENITRKVEPINRIIIIYGNLWTGSFLWKDLCSRTEIPLN